MFNNQEELIINTSNVKDINVKKTILENKLNIYNNLYNEDNQNLLTICILIEENNIEKIKLCVSSIIETTFHLDFHLIYIVNCDISIEIKEFINNDNSNLETVNIISKDIILVENDKINNINFGHFLALSNMNTRYVAIVESNTVVTYKWLDTMLQCAMSEPSIGIVSTINEVEFISQNPDITFDSIEDLQEKSKIWNDCNNNNFDYFNMWEESLYIKNTNICLIKKEVIDNIGFVDLSFENTYSDYTKRALNVGYSNFICNNTFFLNLKVSTSEFKENNDFKKRYNLNYNEEYIYFDNILTNLLYNSNINKSKTKFNKNKNKNEIISILAIDTFAGASILAIKNYLRANLGIKNLNNCNIQAFTTSPKYFNNLNILSNNNATYGNINDLYYLNNSFDYIILGNPINFYYETFELLEKIIRIGKKDCKILIKLENSLDYFSLLKVFNINAKDISINEINKNNNISYYLTFDDFINKIKELNISKCDIDYNFCTDDASILLNSISNIQGTLFEENLVNSCLVKEYCFCLTK